MGETFMRYAMEISEEMNEKISYYSNTVNNSKYIDLKTTIHNQFKLIFTYTNAVDYILNKISSKNS